MGDPTKHRCENLGPMTCVTTYLVELNSQSESRSQSRDQLLFYSRHRELRRRRSETACPSTITSDTVWSELVLACRGLLAELGPPLLPFAAMQDIRPCAEYMYTDSSFPFFMFKLLGVLLSLSGEFPSRSLRRLVLTSQISCSARVVRI